MARKGANVSMVGHLCIIESPLPFAGEHGVILDDNYLGAGMIHVQFLRVKTSAVFHRSEVRILPVMAK